MKKIVLLIIIFLSSATSAYALKISPSVNRTLRVKAYQLLGTAVPSSSVSDFSLSKTDVQWQTSPSSAMIVTTKDITNLETLVGNLLTACQLNFSGSGTPTYTSLSSSIATIDSNGSTTRVSNGTADFKVTSGQRSRGISCGIEQQANQTQYTFQYFATTSLARAMTDSVDALISGKTPSATTQNVYTSVNDTTNVYVRNPNVFTGAVDLTAIPVHSSSTPGTSIFINARISGVLIAPDLVLGVMHAHQVAGDTFYFVNNSNVTKSRTVLSAHQISSCNCDVELMRLSSPLTEATDGIKYVKLFATSTFASGVKISDSAMLSERIPIVYINQNRKASIRVLSKSYYYFGAINEYAADSSLSYNLWNTNIIVGDSGTPALGIVGGELVLVGNWKGVYSTTDPSEYLDLITQMCVTSGSAYCYTLKDVSSYPSY